MSLFRPLRALRRAVAVVTPLAATLAATLALSLPLAAQATLLARDLNADSITDAYYDTTLDISWYANANAFFGSQASVRTTIEAFTLGAASDWRLTQARPVNGTAYNDDFSNNGSTDVGTAETGVGWGLASEIGHLYYVTLAMAGSCTPSSLAPGMCISNPAFSLPGGVGDVGPFLGLDLLTAYLTDEQPAASTAIAFDLRFGSQFIYNEGTPVGYGWAVHDGDVGNLVAGPGPGGGELPVPGTLLLATGALAGLGLSGRGIARRPSRPGRCALASMHGQGHAA